MEKEITANIVIENFKTIFKDALVTKNPALAGKNIKLELNAIICYLAGPEDTHISLK